MSVTPSSNSVGDGSSCPSQRGLWTCVVETGEEQVRGDEGRIGLAGVRSMQGQGLLAVILSWQSAVQAGTSCRPCLLVSQAQCGVSDWERLDVTFPSSAGLCSFCPLSALPASPPPPRASLQQGQVSRGLYCDGGRGRPEVRRFCF